ncbi:unnamed protein product, partial [Didymodactylos carnosus]
MTNSEFSSRPSTTSQSLSDTNTERHRANGHAQKPFNINDAFAVKNNIERQFQNSINQLTIFDERNATEETVRSLADKLIPKRPVTPPDDEVNVDTFPRDIEELLALVRRRLNIRRENCILTFDELSQLATVILTQIRFKWMDIETIFVDHPLIPQKRNNELRRRIFVNILCICESLFENSVKQAQVFHERRVFSDIANMTRLRTLLADNINTLINIHSLREHLASEMVYDERRKRRKNQDDQDENENGVRRSYLSKTSDLLQERPSTRDIVEQFGKSYRYKKLNQSKDSKYYLNEVLSSIPEMNMNRISFTLPTVKETDRLEKKSKEMPTKKLSEDEKSIILREVNNEQPLSLKRSRYGSLPNIHEKFLAEELDLDINQIKFIKLNTTDQIKEQYIPSEDNIDQKKLQHLSNREDLLRLTTETEKELEKEKTDDIPSLIKVLVSTPNIDERIAHHKQTVITIAKRRKSYLNNLKERAQDRPTHPQPQTVEKTIKNIDDDTVVYLDRQLHIGKQIREVYDQLLSTIDVNYYFRMDTDKYVLNCPPHLDLPLAQASSTFSKAKVQQVYNKSIVRRDQPPWSDHIDRKKWVLTPDPKKIEESNKMRKRGGKHHAIVSEPTINLSLIPDPQIIQSYKVKDARQARDFANWRQWWSNEHTSDDYMKYLSTQSTDYLHHIFHLHEKLSKDELNEDEMNLIEERNRAIKEREQKIEELKTRKNKFEQGIWNAETIFLGGLGNEPFLPASEDPIVLFENELERRKPKAVKIDLFDPTTRRKAIS